MRGSIIRRCLVCRRNGKGSGTKCDHKEIVYAIAYYSDGNKQKWETIGPNKKDAERRLAEVISQINNGTYHRPVERLFKDYSQQWLDTHAKATVKESTLRSYRSVVRIHFLPAFGNLPLSKINIEKLLKFKADVLEKRGPKTFNNIIVLLKTMLKHARKWKYISENPAEEIQKARIESAEMDFLKPEEVQAFLKAAYEPYRTLFLTAIMTGMRRGELLGLQWGDIDWHSNQIYVRRSLYWVNEREESGRMVASWKFVPPKSKRSNRAIVMSPYLKKALEIHKINSPVSEHDLVFCNPKGNPMDPDNMAKREFHPALVGAGLRKVRFHDLRHSYCALLISLNESPKFIQSQLGHASIQTTLDRYGHLFPIDSEKVGKKLDAKVFGKKKVNKVSTKNLG